MLAGKTIDVVRLNLVEVDQILGLLIGEVRLTLLNNSLAFSMYCKFGLSRLKDTAVELENLSVDVNLQVGNLRQGGRLKELN